MATMRLCNFILLLSQFLSTRINSAKGVVELSPSGVAPVCRVGGQLELTCTSSSAIHRWEFTIFPENLTHATTSVTSASTSGVSQPLTVGGSMVTFSRLSDQDSLPLVSRAVVSPVSSDLNGTVVNCFEGISSTNSVATTTITIIDPGQFGLSVQSDLEQFSSDRVTVTLEWTLLNSQDHYQQFLQNVSINANPPLDNVIFTGDMRVQLTLSYNTLYNVSVTQNSACERLNRITFLELNYSKCADPMELTNAIAAGYVDPALEGHVITFTCLPGQTLNGCSQSTCMGNGKWEPDPRDMKCIGPNTQATAVYPTSATISGMIAMLRTALILVTCVSVMMSVVAFIAGIACYHCISQRWRAASADINKQPGSHSNPKDTESELELKENVSYISLRSAA